MFLVDRGIKRKKRRGRERKGKYDVNIYFFFFWPGENKKPLFLLSYHEEKKRKSEIFRGWKIQCVSQNNRNASFAKVQSYIQSSTNSSHKALRFGIVVVTTSKSNSSAYYVKADYGKISVGVRYI